MSMSFCLGLGLNAWRGVGVGGSPIDPGDITIPISSTAWTAQEASSDAQTRRTFSTLSLPNQTEYIYGFYRGPLPEGVLTQIGTATWNAATNRYEWTSVGQANLGATVFNRVARRPADLSAPWDWISSPFDTKPWVASNVPDAPSGTWAALASGSVRVTLAPWNGNGRAVTAGSFNRGAGATAFTPAAAGNSTTVDVTGLTDGTPTAVTFTYTNANGTSGALTLTVTAEGAEDPPPPPEVTYLVNGTGTQATVFLNLDESMEYAGSPITAFRYSVDGGTPVVVSGTGPLALTGLAASQGLAVAWTNAEGYSADALIDLIASPPTYADGDWTLTDAVDPAGDVLTVAIVNPVTVPDSIAKIRDEYTLDDGETWQTLPAGGAISTGVPETLAAVKLRVRYDIGPSVPSNEETATPTAPAVEPIPAAIFARGSGQQSGNVTTHNFANPSGSIVGNMVVHLIGFDGNPGALTVAGGTGWTLSALTLASASSDGYALMTAWKVLNGSGDSLTLTSANSEQSSYLNWALSTFGDEPIFSAVNVSSIGEAPNSPNLDFGGELPFTVVSGTVYTQGVAIQTGGPSGYSEFRNQNSGVNGSISVRVAAAERVVTASSENPGPFPVSVPFPLSITIGFPPALSVAPTEEVTVSLSATSIDQGEAVVFTAQADGAAPIDYDLVFDGVTYSQTAPTNLPITFSVTQGTSGSKSWTLTAANAAGSASASGSVTVQERLVFTPSSADPFRITVGADSVVSGAFYDLAWQTTAGGAETIVTQSSPDFTINFPASGAYRFRVRADGGAWSAYGHYAVQTVGGVTWSAENVQAVQISPITADAPVEMVPVTGKLVKLFEVLPPVSTEVSGTGVTHYTNGVVVDPDARDGRGPQGWDSRTGSSAGLFGVIGSFDLSLINTTWPVSLGIGATVSKALSRPTALLASSGGDQGVRYGSIDQHSGLAVVASLSTSLQAPPAIIKDTSWVPGNVDLPGLTDLEDAVAASTLSLSGMTVPSLTSLEQKFCRFNPTAKLLRSGLWSKDDNECFAPFRWAPGSLTNYYAYRTDQDAYCVMASNADVDLRLRMLRQDILRGINMDFPGNFPAIGAGISQDFFMPAALSRLARGMSFLDLVKSENAPYMYGFFDATTITYLEPHNSLSLPTFSRWQTVSAVLSDDAIGSRFQSVISLGGRTWERKQRVAGLDILRESTGQRLRHRAPDYDRDDPSGVANWEAVGFWSTPLTVGERFCFQIPLDSIGNFQIGTPFWMYDTEPGGDKPFRWQSFNPANSMSYRRLQEPHGWMMLLHAIDAYPDIPGSNWQAMKEFLLRTRQANWPGPSPMDYSFNAGTFVTQFWDAHAATLGITL